MTARRSPGIDAERGSTEERLGRHIWIAPVARAHDASLSQLPARCVEARTNAAGKVALRLLARSGATPPEMIARYKTLMAQRKN
jgi:hypothetical protein